MSKQLDKIKNSLALRAKTYKKIRDYFYEKNVLEAEAPILSQYATVDPHIDSLSTQVINQTQYLQTSPEFFLKRLLANGSGDVYSLGKVFRQGERGQRHQPEFTMLEWYRVAWDEHELMDEVAILLRLFLPHLSVRKISYQECFLSELNIDPHSVSVNELKEITHNKLDIEFDSNERSAWLDILISHCIEPSLTEGLVFIYDYPKEQAALAQLEKNNKGQIIARRFEAYLNGMELANGYFELTDADEQKKRFEADQAYRKANDLPIYPYDKNLVDALKNGMPSCSGVAMGVDRLLMILCNTVDISDVVFE
ncbi:MAG: EF-P lysine aminoacylase EpmA [Cellvibrionaceae bacterium]